MYTSLLSNTHKIVIHTPQGIQTPPCMFSQHFLVNKCAFRYIVVFGNCIYGPDSIGLNGELENVQKARSVQLGL